MTHDTFFNLHRFVGLCRKEMVENWKVNLLRSVMTYGLLTIIFLWSGYFKYYDIELRNLPEIDPAWRGELNTFLVGIVAWGCISASFMMERMKTKTNRIASLMTPATMFEKFFSRWLIYTIGFILMFVIAFKLADWTRVAVYSLQYPDIEAIAPASLFHLVGNSEIYYSPFNNCTEFLMALSLYFMSQSFFVLGSAVWPKNAFIKTFVAGIAINVVYSMVAGAFGKMVFPEHYHMSNMNLSDETMCNIVTAFCAVMTLFNWTLAYFRFKESEIINRW